MAYSTSTPPSLVSQGIGGGTGTRTWILSGSNVTTDVDAASFITNARDLGIQVSDTVINLDTTTAATTLAFGHMVNTVASGSPGAANLSVGVSLSTGGTSGD